MMVTEQVGIAMANGSILPRESPSEPRSTPSDLDKLQFDYAWKWFSYHADQRVKMFNFMLVVFGIFATGVVSAVMPPGFVASLCGLGALLGLIFPLLDRRNRDLVWLGEEVLTHLEKTVIFGEGVAITDRKGEIVQLGILLRRSIEEHAQDKRTLRQLFRARELTLLEKWLGMGWHEVWPWARNQATNLWLGKHRVLLPLVGLTMFVIFSIAGGWILLRPQY
jgi:hypothetical protein